VVDALEVDALELGLAAGAAEEVGRDRAFEVVDGAVDRGDWDVVTAGDEPSPSPSRLQL
jgi:predicted short-subunit dehydrogenase-like oxidoreductase (DUF2520 family)